MAGRDLLAEMKPKGRDLLAELSPQDSPQEEARPDSGILPAPVVELASAANRGLTEGFDFLVTDSANYVADKLGFEGRIPRVTDTMQSLGAGREGYMEPGIAREAVQAGGELIPAAVSMGAAAKGIPSLFSRQSPVGNKIAELAESGSKQAKFLADRIKAEAGDVSAATTMVGPTQTKMVADELAKNAVKQGFDKGVVAAVKTSTPQTKARMAKMVDILERGRANSRFGVVNRPSDVVGDAISQRVLTIKSANKNAGKALDQEAKNLVGKKVDISPAIQGYFDDLAEMRVALDDELKPVFTGADIQGVDPSERLISKITSRVKDLMKNPSAYEAHRLKRFIDEHVAYGKNAEGLSGKAERVVKGLRREIDQTLDAQFEGYKRANDEYSETIKALNAFQDVAGKKLDITGENADKAIGTLSRRLMSNVQSRVNMLNALEDMDRLAKKYGGDTSDDVLSMALFADELDSVFKPVARTSLAGDVAKTAAREYVIWGPTGLLRAGVDGTVNYLRGISDEEAIKAIKLLLKRGTPD